MSLGGQSTKTALAKRACRLAFPCGLIPTNQACSEDGRRWLVAEVLTWSCQTSRWCESRGLERPPLPSLASQTASSARGTRWRQEAEGWQSALVQDFTWHCQKGDLHLGELEPGGLLARASAAQPRQRPGRCRALLAVALGSVWALGTASPLKLLAGRAVCVQTGPGRRSRGAVWPRAALGLLMANSSQTRERFLFF